MERPFRADKRFVEAAEQSWRPLGELLVAKGLVNEDELARALKEQEETGRLLGTILVERGVVSGPALAVALAEQYGEIVTYVDRRAFARLRTKYRVALANQQEGAVPPLARERRAADLADDEAALG